MNAIALIKETSTALYIYILRVAFLNDSRICSFTLVLELLDLVV
jgi:hypothetical protein